MESNRQIELACRPQLPKGAGGILVYRSLDFLAQALIYLSLYSLLFSISASIFMMDPAVLCCSLHLTDVPFMFPTAK